VAGEAPWRRPLFEFVAIFAGVSLGLLADDWRDHRNNLRDEVTALELIHADLVSDTSELSFALSPPRRHERAVYWLVHRWDDPSAPVDSIQAALRTFMFLNSYQFRNAAFTSLKEADRLSLIRNDTLRAQVVQYFEEVQVNVDQFLTVLFAEREKTWALLSPYVRWPKPTDPDTAWPLSGPLMLVAPWSEVRSNNSLANAVSALGAVATLSRQIGDRAIEQNEALRLAIEAELVKR